MAAKISNLGKTNPGMGIINLSDLHGMLNGYQKKVSLDCTDPSRNPIQKRFYFDIDFRRLKQIVNQPRALGDNENDNEGNSDETEKKEKFVRIYLSLNMTGQLNCELTESIENSLSILVCGVKDKQSMLSDGDFILAEGFSDNEDLGLQGSDGGGPCCVQGSPLIIT